MGGDPAAATQSTSVTLSTSTEFNAVPFAEKKNIIAMASLVAPPYKQTSQRAPVDLVTVIDVSGSMSGYKISLVKETLDFIVDQLGDGDRLSIVTFSDSAKTVLSLNRMNQSGKEAARRAVQSMHASGSTNLSDGLKLGLSQLKDRVEKREVSSVLLLTDGEANQGFTTAPEIINNVIKEGGGAASNTSGSTTRANIVDCSIHCFGFGADHNAALLRSIAEAGFGTYFFIKEQVSISEAFIDCIGGLLSVVAKNLCIQLRVEGDVTIKEVHTTQFPVTVDVPQRQMSIRIRDLQSEERRDLLFSVDIPSLAAENASPTPIVHVSLSYENLAVSPEKPTFETTSSDILVARPAVVVGEQPVNVEIDKQRNRIRTAAAMEQASRVGDAGNLPAAREAIQSAIVQIQESPSAVDTYSANLVGDLQRALGGLENTQQYQAFGGQQLHNNASSHAQQRSTNVEWGGQAEYQTAFRGVMRKKWADRKAS